MKVLSLLQPWASLVVMGKKKIETRSRNTKYRGTVLIHASQRLSKQQIEITKSSPFSCYISSPYYLPTGKIIGRVDIVTTSILSGSGDGIFFNEYGANFTETELAFGNYQPGRYGWLLANPVEFPNKFACKGSLSIWDLQEKICRHCGCTEYDCKACVQNSCDGQPCYWIDDNLCSACDTLDNHHKDLRSVRIQIPR